MVTNKSRNPFQQLRGLDRGVLRVGEIGVPGDDAPLAEDTDAIEVGRLHLDCFVGYRCWCRAFEARAESVHDFGCRFGRLLEDDEGLAVRVLCDIAAPEDL